MQMRFFIWLHARRRPAVYKKDELLIGLMDEIDDFVYLIEGFGAG